MTVVLTSITHYPDCDETIVKNPLYHSDNSVTTATTVASTKDHYHAGDSSIVSSLSDSDNDSDSFIGGGYHFCHNLPPGVERSCLAHAPSSRRSTLLSERSNASNSSVSFGKIYMREYERIPGDHPQVTIGVPLSIGWAYRESFTTSVTKYERRKMDLFLEDDAAILLKSRKPTGGCGGASTNVKRLGAMTRKRLLMDEFNYSVEEICAAERAVDKFKKQLAKMRQAEENGDLDYECDDNKQSKKSSKMRSLKKGFMNKCGLRTRRHAT